MQNNKIEKSIDKQTRFTMATVDDGYYSFGNGGVTLDTLNSFDFALIKKEVEIIKSNFSTAVDARPYLIGHLKKSYDIVQSRDIIERIVLKLVKDYKPHVNTHIKSLSIFPEEDIERKELKLDRCWVNFQQKHEFQPIHDHAGVFSFIIFYQIPFLFRDEVIASPGSNANEQLSGMLNFHYIDYAGSISSMAIPADKNWEGRIFVFPAKLHHSVYPFYSSDDFRITISGNLSIVEKE